jgi:hypothetical protein
VALCILVTAALYGISEQLSSRVQQRVSNLKIKQQEAVQMGQADLVQQFVRDTASLSSLERRFETWIIVCLAACGVGQAAGVFRIIRRSDPESAVEWWVLLIMQGVLCVQVVGISVGWVSLAVIA